MPITFFELKIFLLCFTFLTNNELSVLFSSWYWAVNENSVSEVENSVERKICVVETIEVSWQAERVEAVEPGKEKVL